jgi:hypothetical protein
MKSLSLIFSLLAFFGICQSAHALPSRIIIIRHAEKPDDDTQPDLSEAGRARAAAMPGFFSSNSVILEKSSPDVIYAMVGAHGDSTQRPLETVQPLSQALQKPVDNTFKNSHIQDLIQQLLTNPALNDKVVLICWNREGPPVFAAGLGVVNVPKWKSATFDHFWVLDFNNDGIANFRDLPEMLMPGDSQN